MAKLTSESLVLGALYSREQLMREFGIVDATIRTGVFRPRDHDSIWLFVTETKTADRTQYRDQLDCDNLWWDGQSAGRTDRLVIDHASNGLELLVFYRRARDEHPDYAFRYEGRFRYVSHEPGSPEARTPSRFHLRRVTD